MSDLNKKYPLVVTREDGTIIRMRKLPLRIRILHRVEDFFDDINWMHVAFKVCAFSYIAFLGFIAWQVLPLPGHWTRAGDSDKIPITYQDFDNYFSSFEGFAQCNIKASDLYTLPPRNSLGQYEPDAFCSTRKRLLESMSNGGRAGFDAPYTPSDCHYRWYTTAEICMILERFDAIVFVGDGTLQAIYSGLNILLRQDLSTGALKSWEMDKDNLESCRCDSQFTTPACGQHVVTSSDEVNSNTPSIGSGYACSRFPHALLHINGSPASEDVIERFVKLVPRVPRSNYHPVPIIHSLSPSSISVSAASESLLQFLTLADSSKRKTPMLWVGPTAAGHIDVKDRKGNQEIWDFDAEMAQVAVKNDIEVLKMWNLTVQVSSFDGLHFGEKVAITQAMMVVNWLSRLESS